MKRIPTRLSLGRRRFPIFKIILILITIWITFSILTSNNSTSDEAQQQENIALALQNKIMDFFDDWNKDIIAQELVEVDEFNERAINHQNEENPLDVKKELNEKNEKVENKLIVLDDLEEDVRENEKKKVDEIEVEELDAQINKKEEEKQIEKEKEFLEKVAEKKNDEEPERRKEEDGNNLLTFIQNQI